MCGQRFELATYITVCSTEDYMDNVTMITLLSDFNVRYLRIISKIWKVSEIGKRRCQSEEKFYEILATTDMLWHPVKAFLQNQTDTSEF